ncbi:MAG: hypothetical protein ACM32G_07310 [Betaproteobacteria bacterium]
MSNYAAAAARRHSAPLHQVVQGACRGEGSSVLPLSCGNCFECYGACPEDAIAKLGPSKRYQYIYELCTGCAICFEQCPCHSSA